MCLCFQTNNILSPSSGDPITIPTKDIILGLYYLSLSRPNQKGEGAIVTSLEEAQHLLLAGKLTLHTRIKARVAVCKEDEKLEYKVYDNDTRSSNHL